MEATPTDFELVRAGHKCEHCYKRSHNIEEIRLAAENQCPSARIWLASIGWAASRLDYTDISFETHTQSTIMKGFVTLEIFELDSRFKNRFMHINLMYEQRLRQHRANYSLDAPTRKLPLRLSRLGSRNALSAIQIARGRCQDHPIAHCVGLDF
jgi:hypothetical protein